MGAVFKASFHKNVSHQKKTTVGIAEPTNLAYYCTPFRKKWNINSSLAQLVRASDC
jgi:hypothetical protein